MPPKGGTAARQGEMLKVSLPVPPQAGEKPPLHPKAAAAWQRDVTQLVEAACKWEGRAQALRTRHNELLVRMVATAASSPTNELRDVLTSLLKNYPQLAPYEDTV